MASGASLEHCPQKLPSFRRRAFEFLIPAILSAFVGDRLARGHELVLFPSRNGSSSLPASCKVFVAAAGRRYTRPSCQVQKAVTSLYTCRRDSCSMLREQSTLYGTPYIRSTYILHATVKARDRNVGAKRDRIQTEWSYPILEDAAQISCKSYTGKEQCSARVIQLFARGEIVSAEPIICSGVVQLS